MLCLRILLLFAICFANAGTYAKCEKQQSLEDLVEKLESRLAEVELEVRRLKDQAREREERETWMPSKDKEREAQSKTPLEKRMRDKTDEIARSKSQSKISLTEPSLRTLPTVLISVWRSSPVQSPQTVTYESFLVNYISLAPEGMFDLESGVFTCAVSGFYSVSFSAYTVLGPEDRLQSLYLYKNGGSVHHYNHL